MTTVECPHCDHGTVTRWASAPGHPPRPVASYRCAFCRGTGRAAAPVEPAKGAAA